MRDATELEANSINDYVNRISVDTGVNFHNRRGDRMRKEDPRLQGLCKECTHRNSCADAKRYLNVTGCTEYRHWKKVR